MTATLSKAPRALHGHCVGGLSPTYKVWVSMRRRCYYKTEPAYKYYGARGITVCPEWRKFVAFLNDMGPAPEGMSIERKDVNLGYSKENCRWATLSEQARNKTNTQWVEYRGETLCVFDWAERLGVKANTLVVRLARGWSVDRAFNTAVLARAKTKEPSAMSEAYDIRARSNVIERISIQEERQNQKQKTLVSR